MPTPIVPRHSHRPAALVLAAYTLLTLGMTYPLVTAFGRAIPGDGFDGWQNYWNLWWVKTALLEQRTLPWFTDLLYHPTGVGLLFHTLNPFNGITFLPIQLAWGLLPAYNSAVVFSFAVGGLGTYLLARHVLGPGTSRLAAFVAGIIFTFSPYHIAHLLGHMQLISLEWIPFYVLYLLRTVEAARGSAPARPGAIIRNALLAAGFLILVTFCDWYYLLYGLLITALVVLWAAWQAFRARAGRPFARLAGAVGVISLVWAFALSPWLVPMVREARQYNFMVPDSQQSRVLSADLLAFVTPQEFHPLWGKWAQEQARVFTATVSEHQVFAGFTVLALAALGILASRRSAPRHPGPDLPSGHPAVRRPEHHDTTGFWLLALVSFFVLALGPVLHVAGRTDVLPGGRELPLPYGPLAQMIPFMDITRSVSRFDTMVMLALAMLAAAGIHQLVRRGHGLGRAVANLTVALILFEFLPVPYPMSAPDTPAWYHTLGADSRPGAVLNLPMNWDRPGYLLYQTEHGKPLTAAYISREDPRTLVERVPVLQHFRHLGPDIIVFDLAGQGQHVLADLDIRWVVLDRYKMPGGRERTVTETTAAEIFGAQAPVYRDERLTVYEVTPPPVAAPYLLLGAGWGPFDAVQGTRAFGGQAQVCIQAPTAGGVILRITLAPGSAPLALAGDQANYLMQLTLQPGANEVILRSADPTARVIVARLALER